MKGLLDNRFHWIRDALHLPGRKNVSFQGHGPEVLEAVENVVDDTDSRIRLVAGYKKKLQPVVEHALEYTDELVNRIPPAIEVSSRSFTSDPYVNAFFTNVPDLRSIFSHSSEIQDYMEGHYDEDLRCCALLCMHRSERTVFGMELSGDILKRDVPQVAVSFSDHRVYSPAPSESEARNGLKRCLFQGLVTNALEHIMELQQASHKLQSRHRILHARLRHFIHRARTVDGNSETAEKLARDTEATRRELAQVEEQMMKGPALLTPQLLLGEIIEVFRGANAFVKMQNIPLRLNKMGIKISDDSPQPCNKLDLTEAVIGDEPPRVIALANFPRKEMLPRTVFRL